MRHVVLFSYLKCNDTVMVVTLRKMQLQKGLRENQILHSSYCQTVQPTMQPAANHTLTNTMDYCFPVFIFIFYSLCAAAFTLKCHNNANLYLL